MGTAAGDRHALSPADIARAVPPGSRRIRSQREALHRGLACPDLADARADFRGHLRDWWRIHVLHASWGGAGRPPRGTTEPTRARVCELAGISVSTYKACRRWWEARGYIAIARPGSTPDLCPSVLSSPGDGNVRQAYVLCVPRERRQPPHHAAPRPLTRPLSKSRRDLYRFPAREARDRQGTDKDHKEDKPDAPWSPLLRQGPLRGLTQGWWVHITAPFAGWSASDLVWAVDHLPDGRQHRMRTANVRHPAGWLRWRLSHWLNPDGTARPSPSQERSESAERHRAYLARRDRELGIARRAAALRAGGGYETAAPSPQEPWTPPPRRRGQGVAPVLAGWAARRGGGSSPAAGERREDASQPDRWTVAAASGAAGTGKLARGPRRAPVCHVPQEHDVLPPEATQACRPAGSRYTR